MRLFFAIFLVFGLWSSAQAKTVVLIHGLDSDSRTWAEHHVVDALFASGWQMGSWSGEQGGEGSKNRPDKVFYAVNLPWFEPIETQAKVLRTQLAQIYQQRQEPLILVGHSAGGIVGRFLLLTPNPPPIRGLITIASPHLGSPWAEMAWRALQSPMGDFLEVMGAEKWVRAETLLWELSVTPKTNLIHWMNRQPHPWGVRYISVVHRMRAQQVKMDLFVPMASQNMNNVPALRGRAEAYPLFANHKLTRQDGVLLAWLLSSFK